MKKLCNFLPYLVGEITLDDGAEQKKCFRIGGVHASGQPPPEITLPVSEFSAMGWIVERWGAKCNLEPGQSVKEQIRYAIQSTGEKAEQVVIYGQLDWKKYPEKSGKERMRTIRLPNQKMVRVMFLRRAEVL